VQKRKKLLCPIQQKQRRDGIDGDAFDVLLLRNYGKQRCAHGCASRADRQHCGYKVKAAGYPRAVALMRPGLHCICTLPVFREI
jgi:hypothetical protein